MIEIFFGMDWKDLFFFLAALCVLLLIVLACFIIYHRYMITYKNRGIVKQIYARDKCEEELRKLASANARLYERLQQKEVKSQATANMPELYLIASDKPLSASFSKENIIDGNFKIIPLRSAEE